MPKQTAACAHCMPTACPLHAQLHTHCVPNCMPTACPLRVQGLTPNHRLRSVIEELRRNHELR